MSTTRARPSPDPEAPAATEPDALRAALARQKERFDSVVAIGRAIGSTLDIDEILRLLIEHTSQVLRAERSTLFLIDPLRKEIWSKVVQGDGLQEIRLPLGSGVAGWVCLNDKPVVVADTSRDPRFNAMVDRSTGFRTRSMVVVPLHDVTGGVLGAIQVLNALDGTFTDEDRALLEAIAAQAGVAIENARLYRDAVARNRELSEAKEALAESMAELDLLFEIEKRISGAGSMEELLDSILAKALGALGAEAGSVLLTDEESRQLVFKTERGEPVRNVRLTREDGIASTVARTGEPILTNDAAAHPAFDARVSGRTGVVARSVLCVPLRVDARVIGALELLNKRDGAGFEPRDLRLAALLAGQVAHAVMLGRQREQGERKARLAVIGQMISGILHDLRTPMTIISGYSELMVDEPDLDERRRSAEVIVKQLDHMNAMARETLAFARGEREILLRTVHLNSFLDEVQEFLARDLEGKRVELQVRASYRGPVRLDEAKIKRAIYNIARNAAQAMPDGGRFTIDVERDGEQVVFRFSDTGIGIPEEIADRLFESFVTAGKQEGTGLGLAIVKKVVEAHGGDITFRSDPGKGTTFVFRIPG